MFSSFIHVMTNDRIHLSLWLEQYSIVYIISYLHASVNMHSDWFYVFAIVNDDMVNMGGWASLRDTDFISLG